MSECTAKKNDKIIQKQKFAQCTHRSSATQFSGISGDQFVFVVDAAGLAETQRTREDGRRRTVERPGVVTQIRVHHP